MEHLFRSVICRRFVGKLDSEKWAVLSRIDDDDHFSVSVKLICDIIVFVVIDEVG